MSEDEDYISHESTILLCNAETEQGYKVSVLKSAHPAVRKRAFAQILNSVMNKSVENKHIELLNELIINNSGKIEVAENLYLVVHNGVIYTEKNENNLSFWKSEFICGTAETPVGEYSLSLTDKILPDSIDADKIKGDLYLSSRLEGDSFTFKARGVTKSLKKLFNELKIPANKRNLIPVLHDESSVVWIENIGVNAAYIPDINTGKIIIIKKRKKKENVVIICFKGVLQMVFLNYMCK